MILELAFFIIAVFLMTVFGGFIAYSWNIPLGIIGLFSVILFLLIYKRMAAVDAQVSEEQRSLELWRQEHRAINFIIYLFALAIALGAGYFACEKNLAKEFGKKEGQNFSNIKNIIRPIETTLAGAELRDKEIIELCQQIKEQQKKIQSLETIMEEIKKGVSEYKQDNLKETEIWLKEKDKTNQVMQTAIKEIEQLKTVLSAQEKNIKEFINKDIKNNLEKIKAEIELIKKAATPATTPAPTPTIIATPDQPPIITEEEKKKEEEEGEKK